MVSISNARRFDERSLALHAAETGQGILLASTILEAESLADGRLIPVSRVAAFPGRRYYGHCPAGRYDCAEERALLDWLKREGKGE